MAEEKETEVVAAEKEEVKAVPIGRCPFCDGSMKEVSREELREGTFTTKECVRCGFRATFRKSVI